MEHLSGLELGLEFLSKTNETRGMFRNYSFDNASVSDNSTDTAANNTFFDALSQFGLLTDELQKKATFSHYFFTYFTPVIICFGIIGNIMSLVVFLSRNMRKLSASRYLTALSVSDLMVLVFYVLPEWLKHGLTLLPGHHTAIYFNYHWACQILLYLQYIARFLSSLFVVCFTIERFIGVRFPLQRRDICDPQLASRVILGAGIVAFTTCLFKPILSVSYTAPNGNSICTSDKKHEHVSFILDNIFGVVITLIPFVLITVLNLLMIKTLCHQKKRHRFIRATTKESAIKLEFTFILLAVSICFVAFNLPYFVVWCRRYWVNRKILYMKEYSWETIREHNDQIGYLDEILHVTRTIFYLNYCINFFLYSFAGANFRKELKKLFVKKGRRKFSCKLRPILHGVNTSLLVHTNTQSTVEMEKNVL